MGLALDACMDGCKFKFRDLLDHSVVCRLDAVRCHIQTHSQRLLKPCVCTFINYASLCVHMYICIYTHMYDMTIAIDTVMFCIGNATVIRSIEFVLCDYEKHHAYEFK